ncbi:MAG TPA: hypothetical protein VLX91_13640 [Candidatus Acidoferrales bacterium]|nr:hypothetical protein [Candidatus Acidoferrales bacterium]
MIPVLIFWMHITAGVYLLAKRYYEETLGEALLAVGFAGIIFTAGWTLSSFMIRITFGKEGVSAILDGDSLSLILLTVFEVVFYRVWFRKSPQHPEDSTPGQPADA